MLLSRPSYCHDETALPMAARPAMLDTAPAEAAAHSSAQRCLMFLCYTQAQGLLSSGCAAGTTCAQLRCHRTALTAALTCPSPSNPASATCPAGLQSIWKPHMSPVLLRLRCASLWQAVLNCLTVAMCAHQCYLLLPNGALVAKNSAICLLILSAAMRSSGYALCTPTTLQ